MHKKSDSPIRFSKLKIVFTSTTCKILKTQFHTTTKSTTYSNWNTITHLWILLKASQPPQPNQMRNPLQRHSPTNETTNKTTFILANLPLTVCNDFPSYQIVDAFRWLAVASCKLNKSKVHIVYIHRFTFTFYDWPTKKVICQGHQSKSAWRTLFAQICWQGGRIVIYEFRKGVQTGAGGRQSGRAQSAEPKGKPIWVYIYIQRYLLCSIAKCHPKTTTVSRNWTIVVR